MSVENGSGYDGISFAGQVAVITGSGQSMGRTHALDIASRGGTVVVNDIVRDKADAVVVEITESGGEAIASYESVATPKGGKALVDLALDRFGRVDVFIHNAGFLRNHLFEDLTPDQIDEVFAVHLGAAFYVGQPAYRSMKENGYGRIVLTGSTSGMFGRPGQANYCAAKTGLFGVCNALAHEGPPHGILANCVLPKTVSSIARDRQQPGFAGTDDERRKSKALDVRKTGQQVTALVSFLASRACSVTGQTFSACAGMYSRVFAGLAAGWLAPDATAVTAEDIQAHFEEIEDLRFDGLVPRSPWEEMSYAYDRLVEAGYMKEV